MKFTQIFSVQIGCDRSVGLLNVCRQRQLNVFQCDCLQVPIRDNSVNGCISIAVIHHLASRERRCQALREMARILISGGKGLVYVWAKNQALQNEKSSYLRQNKQNNRSVEDGVKPAAPVEYCDGLPIHTNRTQFQHQDILVPWKLKVSESNDKIDVGTTTTTDLPTKVSKTFLRYYHVFDEIELETLCAQVQDIDVIKSYYDQGNWCVIFQKK